jgi:UrcA family protein
MTPDDEATGLLNAKSAQESVMSFTKFIGRHTARIALMLASASLTLAIHAAQANDLNPPTQKVVSFRDLNMHSPEGIEIAFKRIKNAARDVCATPDRYDLSESALKPCINDAVAKAVAQVDSPLLTSLYESKSSKTAKKVTFAQVH